MKTAALFILAWFAYGQVRSNPADAGGANLPFQPIGPNDLLAISVYDTPELTRTVRVSSDGFIRLPMLKGKIRAEGLMPSEVEGAIADQLKAQSLFIAPFVTVTVAEYSSRPVSVMGAVRKPTTFQAVGRMTLLDALTRAEGLSADAGPVLVLASPGGTAGEKSLRRIPLKTLLEEADPRVNVELKGGEEIRIPSVDRVFVVGNVKRPGAFPLPDAQEGTVLQVLALAEGLTPFAARQAFIYRMDGGTRKEVPIELSRILERKQDDVRVLPNDIVYIPDNKRRRATMAAIERIASFGSSAGATALIYGAAH